MSFWTWLKGQDINKGVAECRETPGAVLIDVRSPWNIAWGTFPAAEMYLWKRCTACRKKRTPPSMFIAKAAAEAEERLTF